MSDGKGKSNHYSPVKQQGKASFGTFIWNSSTGEFLGRTGISWFKITLFYIFFFAGLAAFFGLMLYIFLLTLNPNEPKWVQDSGLIGTNPGIGFRPMPDQDKNVESTLIWFNRQDERNDPFWAKELDKFFKEKYTDNNDQSSGDHGPQTCSFGGNSATPDKACKIDVTSLNAACSKINHEFGYGGGIGTPCVLVKLNKIYKWKPEPYKTHEDLKEAKKRGMPDYLIQQIEGLINTSSSSHELDTTWVTCEGENPADRENIGPLEYYSPHSKEKPFNGIPNFYFPFQRQRGYKAPFVFVKFTKPQSNVLIQVECKAWAKNIRPDRQMRLGSVHFELMID